MHACIHSVRGTDVHDAILLWPASNYCNLGEWGIPRVPGKLVSMHACMYVCACMRLWVCVCVCVCVCMFISVCVYVYAHGNYWNVGECGLSPIPGKVVSVHACMRACMCVYLYVCVCAYVCMFVCMYVHIQRQPSSAILLSP